jgi:hypothetical protein
MEILSRFLASVPVADDRVVTKDGDGGERSVLAACSIVAVSLIVISTPL